MSDDLDFIVIDDIPEYTFCIPDDEELENVIPVKGEDGSFKYEKVAELPETGEDGVLYLVPKPHETQTASGNPISINVTEGAGKLSDLKLDGDATQSGTPTPDSPVDIHTVTGAQTIDINGTSYLISLGNIELLKIDTYRDYIYKSGTDWYIKKQTGKVVLDGAENWGIFSNGKSFYATVSDAFILTLGTEVAPILADYYTAGTYQNVYNGNVDYGITFPAGGANHRVILRNKDCADVATLKTWLSSNPTTVYYALATPTTTQITDTNLINQLEAARNAALANGTNVISNTATGNNLAGDLELSYYEYDPTNKYNKWLWLGDDAAYEQM